MSDRHWEYINRKTGAKIVVSDPQSAMHLATLLAEHPDWEIPAIEQPPVDACVTLPGTTSPNVTLLELPQVAAEKAPPALRPVQPPAPPQAQRDRRAHNRFSVKFRVIITTSKISFQSYTTDISLGGMKLHRRAPQALLGQPCRVYIANEDGSEKIEIECRILPESEENHSRVRFVDAPPASLERLEGWFNAIQGKARRAANGYARR